jgi:hypothetical protein
MFIPDLGSGFYSNPGSGSATLKERMAYPAGSPVVAAVEQAKPLRLQPQPLRHLGRTNQRLGPQPTHVKQSNETVNQPVAT